MNDGTLLLYGIFWLGMMAPLIFFSSNKANQGIIILVAIFFSPLIGWLAYLIAPDKPTLDPSKDKFARKLKSLHGAKSEDPLAVWERQQRINDGPPPPPSKHTDH